MSSHAKELRPDIQAMRAIAVVAVFAYHLWPSRVPGGFVGVDVFFVISGFLITGNLIREAERTGRIDVWSFWSRRIRRLLPAALLVIAVSSVAVFAWVPQNLWPQFLRESIAATLYVQNWVLAADSVDYLAADNAPSAVQHFWTLSVEEQFYIFTPLLLILFLIAGRRLMAKRAILLAGIGAITLASLIDSVWLTSVNQPAAYFVTTTRAWEFGVGALLVFAPPATSVRAARVAVVAGLIGVVSSVFVISGELPFPGALAAWPVLATAAMIWGGRAMGARWLAAAGVRPIRFTGDVSYAAYLWHWPLIVILPFALDRALTTVDKVGILVATLALAGLSTRFVEDPIRYSPRLLGGGRSPRTIGAWGAAGMAAVVGLAGIGLITADTRRVEAAEKAAVVVTKTPECLGAMAIVNRAACAGMVSTDVLVPDPAHASTDTFGRADCWSKVDVAELHMCTLGPADADVRLAAIGDSHSNALLLAYQALAERNGWRIDVAGHNGCFWTTSVQVKPAQAMVEGCEGWKANLSAYLAGTDPYDAIVVTNARDRLHLVVEDGEDMIDAAVSGLLEAWATQTSRGTRIIAIRDNPAMPADVVTCVVQHPTLANERCSRPARRALGARDALVEAAARSDNARVIDLTDIYCPGGVCVPVIGNVVVYQDRDHLTATFVRSLVSVLDDRLRAALP